MWPDRESNPRLLALESDALPTALLSCPHSGIEEGTSHKWANLLKFSRLFYLNPFLPGNR